MSGRWRGIAAVTTVALIAGGCGGGASTPERSEAATQTLDEIEQICDTLNAAVAGREFPVDDFDPENPSADDLPAVGEFFAPASQAQTTALAAVRALTPPDELAQDVDAFEAALANLLEVSTSQVEAGRAADVDRWVATLDDASAVGVEVTDAADALGIESCRLGG